MTSRETWFSLLKRLDQSSNRIHYTEQAQPPVGTSGGEGRADPDRDPRRFGTFAGSNRDAPGGGLGPAGYQGRERPLVEGGLKQTVASNSTRRGPLGNRPDSFGGGSHERGRRHFPTRTPDKLEVGTAATDAPI